MADFWDAVIDIGGGLLSAWGAGEGAEAAREASGAEAAAAARAGGISERAFEAAREDFAPYRDVGKNALYNLAALYGLDYEGAPGTAAQRQALARDQFTTSPGYEFRREEGLRGITQAGAGAGKLASGQTLKALQDYGAGQASSEYGRHVNVLQSAANLGQTATGSTANLGSADAARRGRAATEEGAARASGYVGEADAYTNAINNMLYWGGRRTA
jgi:hypothetical protein